MLVKHMWLHMNQNLCYVTESLTFNQLTFQQFVGGECRTILKATNDEEVYGRLRILSKIAYLFEQCKNWDRARSTYFAILSSIEEGEANWNSSFRHYDLMCPVIVKTKAEKTMTRSQTPTMCRDYFCKEFQKGECLLTSPHKAWICNNQETVEHYCVVCQKAKLGKLMHVPGAEACSQLK